MDDTQFGRMMQADFEALQELAQTKGQDYSGKEDRLASFKQLASDLGLTPEQVWGVFAGKHWTAIMTFVREGDVASEPIEGRIHDLILYGFLLLAMVREERSLNPPEPPAQIEGGPTIDCLAEDVERVTAGWEKWQVRQVLTPDPRDPETFGAAWLTVESVERADHNAIVFVIPVPGQEAVRWAVPRDKAIEVREAL